MQAADFISLDEATSSATDYQSAAEKPGFQRKAILHAIFGLVTPVFSWDGPAQQEQERQQMSANVTKRLRQMETEPVPSDPGASANASFLTSRRIR